MRNNRMKVAFPVLYSLLTTFGFADLWVFVHSVASPVALPAALLLVNVSVLTPQSLCWPHSPSTELPTTHSNLYGNHSLTVLFIIKLQHIYCPQEAWSTNNDLQSFQKVLKVSETKCVLDFCSHIFAYS